MTYEEFKNEVLGKGYDIDGAFGEQCPMKGTLIEKANGIWVEVENLVKGDRLKGGNIVLSNNRKKSEIIHIETALGHLYVSPEHRFILADGSECLARNLTIGQIIQSDLIEEVTDPEYDLTDDELRFLGLWFADGTKKYRWETSQSPECFVTVGADQKVKYIEGLNLSLNKKFHSNGKALIYVLCNKKHPNLVRAIDETKNKEMTRRFTKDQFALIIEGYIVGDGSPKHNSSATTSVDKKLLLSVQYGCSINGWRAKLSKPRIRTEVQVNGYCKSPKPLYQLTVNKNKKPVAKVLKIEKYGKEDIYVLNVDGNHTYYAENHLHHNCWDLFGYYCQRLGYPVIHTDKTGYAQDLWESRATNGILNSFDEVTMMEPGDVAIFKRTAYTPLSHVAIFDHDIDGVNGAFLGQNQGGQVVSPNGGSASNIISLPYSATYDTAFRPKCFVEEPDPAPVKPAHPISEGETGSIYRFYNLYTGDHFYTQNIDEADQLYGLFTCETGQKKTIGWAYEGIAWVAPENGDPVYRLYEPTTGQHIYTPDPAERSSLVGSGWNDEGIAWYSGGSHPVYRLYNPNSGEHLLTPDRHEHDALCGSGWICEGTDINF